MLLILLFGVTFLSAHPDAELGSHDFVNNQSFIPHQWQTPLMPLLKDVNHWDLAEFYQYAGELSEKEKHCLIQKDKWKTCFDSTIFVEKKITDLPQNKVSQWIKKFSSFRPFRRMAQAAILEKDFNCEENVTKAYGLALSLEKDFPESESQAWARALLHKVIQCERFPYRVEAAIRLGLLYLLNGQANLAIGMWEQAKEMTNVRYVHERVTYLIKMAQRGPNGNGENSRNSLTSGDYEGIFPISPYGFLLGSGVDQIERLSSKGPSWSLQIEGSQQSTRHLVRQLLFLALNQRVDQVRWIGEQLDINFFLRTESPEFLVNLAFVFSKIGYDLAAFRILHAFLSQHPNLFSPDLLPLLFPIRFWDLIVEASADDLDPILVKALIRQESAFVVNAKSRVRAMGLMQVMPGMARVFGVRNIKDLLQPPINLRVGTQYFRQLLQRFGSVDYALAGYNAGPKKVEEWLKRYPTS
ncbi:MAG: lytic transglycosylase domain-containing protein, partial [Pseudobdellovibrionaceae bacterium]|nr:lytic transglycosylase domain-containing protein [Pseudobdellovibrionaceae bacterium]